MALSGSTSVSRVRPSSRRRDPEVIVIGAGLAGLTAAASLEAEGARVQVIEARARVGGRLWTLDHLPGRPEAGAIQIGEGYGRLLAAARLGGVELARAPTEAPRFAYQIGETIIAPQDWPATDANRLEEAERATPPHALLFSYLPRLAALGPAGRAGSVEAGLRAAGAGVEARRLIACNFNGESPERLSLGFLLASLAGLGGGASAPSAGWLSAPGGSLRIAEALAARLASPPIFEAEVGAIAVQSDVVEVAPKRGDALRARTVICTAPAPALRRMRLEAPLDPDFREAMSRIDYTAVTQLHFAVERRFWEDDGLPRHLWSDGALGRVLDGGREDNLVVWLMGAAARSVDRIPRDLAAQQVEAALVAARPAARGAVRFLQRVSWADDPFAGGAYHAWAPGDYERFAPAMSRSAGRLHFAGEHTLQQGAGMERAMASGESAARAALTQL